MNDYLFGGKGTLILNTREENKRIEYYYLTLCKPGQNINVTSHRVQINKATLVSNNDSHHIVKIFTFNSFG